jgi:hypothetical protein
MALNYSKMTEGLDFLELALDNPDALELVRNTINLRVGRTTPFKGLINGQKVNAFATLNSAKLTRLSLLRQSYADPNSSTGPDYYIVTGQFNPVSIDITIDNDGEMVPLYEVWRQMAMSLKGQNSESTVSSEAWLANLSRMGLNYTSTPYQLYFQQMGADEAKIEQVFNKFIDLGAYDDVATMAKNSKDPNRPQRMERCLAIDEGLDVVGFELSSVNIEKIASKQGFVDLADAMTKQFTRITQLRSNAFILENQIENDDNLSDGQIKAGKAKIAQLRTLSNQFTTSFSGAQLKTRKNPVTGELEWLDDYSPTQAPCGRFEVLVDGETIKFDLWKDRNGGNSAVSNETSVPALKIMDSTADPLGDDN